jgi:hypothetical protein
VTELMTTIQIWPGGEVSWRRGRGRGGCRCRGLVRPVVILRCLRGPTYACQARSIMKEGWLCSSHHLSQRFTPGTDTKQMKRVSASLWQLNAWRLLFVPLTIVILFPSTLMMSLKSRRPDKRLQSVNRDGREMCCFCCCGMPLERAIGIIDMANRDSARPHTDKMIGHFEALDNIGRSSSSSAAGAERSELVAEGLNFKQ